MRPHQIFASMSPEHAESFFALLAEKAEGMWIQCVHAAAANMKARPRFVLKQSKAKQAQSVRRTLSRVNASPLAEEILAIYYLECRVEILTEWLDLLGIEHEDGVLKADAPEQPDPSDLAKHVATLRGDDADPDRLLLLRAFAAQSAIDWPALDEMLVA